MTTLEVCDYCKTPITKIHVMVSYFGNNRKSVNYYCDEDCMLNSYKYEVMS